MDEIRVPTAQDVDELELAARALEISGAAEHFAQAIIVAAYTGVRLGELLALEWIDVDGDELQVTKQRRRDGGTGSTKNGHDRTALILPQAIEALQQVAGPQRVHDAPSSIEDMAGFRYRIFDYSRREHTRVWGEVRSRTAHRIDERFAGIRWHDLRHFYATTLIDMGASDLDVALQLGHRDGGKLVRERYGHPSPARARERLRRLTGPKPAVEEFADRHKIRLTEGGED